MENESDWIKSNTDKNYKVVDNDYIFRIHNAKLLYHSGCREDFHWFSPRPGVQHIHH